MKAAIQKLVRGEDLKGEEAEEAMVQIMKGEATPAQIAAFLTALRIKGETVGEIASAARVMRRFAETIHPAVGDRPLIDTCGTGGDRVKTFNVSTIAAFVISGAGLPIAKHGNRSVTSKAGSADLLEALGVRIDLPPKKVEEIIERIGIGFLFAPTFHRAMKHAIGVRREIGIRTIFNLLGPLTNPANARRQLVGVYDPELTEILACVLRDLGTERGLVVHGLCGMDEISTVGETKVSELKEGEVRTYTLRSEDVGLPEGTLEGLAGGEPEENARIALEILRDGEGGDRREIVLLNAGAGVYLGGLASTIREGVELAREAVDSGKAFEKLLRLVEATGGDRSRLEA
jgi:anthranilate phosphoribosyltransferase